MVTLSRKDERGLFEVAGWRPKRADGGIYYLIEMDDRRMTTHPAVIVEADLSAVSAMTAVSQTEHLDIMQEILGIPFYSSGLILVPPDLKFIEISGGSGSDVVHLFTRRLRAFAQSVDFEDALREAENEELFCGVFAYKHLARLAQISATTVLERHLERFDRATEEERRGFPVREHIVRALTIAHRRAA